MQTDTYFKNLLKNDIAPSQPALTLLVINKTKTQLRISLHFLHFVSLSLALDLRLIPALAQLYLISSTKQGARTQN